jgi:hypothetical protein
VVTTAKMNVDRATQHTAKKKLISFSPVVTDPLYVVERRKQQNVNKLAELYLNANIFAMGLVALAS